MFPVLPDVPATASCRRRSAQRPGVSPRCSRRTRPLHTGNCCSGGPPTSACAATIPPLHRTTVYPEPLVSFAVALSYRALVLGEPRTSPPLVPHERPRRRPQSRRGQVLEALHSTSQPRIRVDLASHFYPSLLVPESRPRASHTPPAGETRRPEPPSSPTTPLRASPNPNKPPGGLRMSRTPPTAKRQPERTPGAPDWLSPALLRRGKSSPAAFRRRPARPLPLAARSGNSGPD